MLRICGSTEMALLPQLRRVVDNRAVQVFTRAETDMLGDLDRSVPVKTGRLKRSRVSRASYGGSRAAVTVTYPPEYARYTDEGTRPHLIVPRRAKALRFVKGGRVIFARRVHHPGTKGTRWWTQRTNTSAWREYLRKATR